MRFSRRADWEAGVNRLTTVRAERAAAGLETLDLTLSNPTRAGLDYPADELASILASASRAEYRPEPLGIPSAREAVAAWLTREGDEVAPEDIVITASTSEAYSYLFKLFSDPGDELLTPRPAYPLLEHLASLELVALRHFDLEYLSRSRTEGRWALDVDHLAAEISARTAAVIVVHPNNPTGSYLTAPEQERLADLCEDRGIPLISDEVFFDFPLRGGATAPPAAARRSGLAFSLGGLSKSAGLPHWKLGWIRLGGSEEARRATLAGLELIADSYLSVSTPVQEALPAVLRLAPRIAGAIRERTAANLRRLAALVEAEPMMQLLPAEGGWSAVIRIPRLQPDEDFVLDLLAARGVFVHPGYFFDFHADGFLVVSLLTPPDVLEEGIARLIDFVRQKV